MKIDLRMVWYHHHFPQSQGQNNKGNIPPCCTRFFYFENDDGTKFLRRVLLEVIKSKMNTRTPVMLILLTFVSTSSFIVNPVEMGTLRPPRFLCITNLRVSISLSSKSEGDVETDFENTPDSLSQPPQTPFFTSQNPVDLKALKDEADLSDPKQQRVIIYIVLSLLPVLFLIPLMLNRDLIPLDALPPVEMN